LETNYCLLLFAGGTTGGGTGAAGSAATDRGRSTVGVFGMSTKGRDLSFCWLMTFRTVSATFGLVQGAEQFELQVAVRAEKFIERHF
jgi:hypothetical protein